MFLYLPVALIPLFSFNDSIQAAFPLKGFTLAWYEGLAGNATLVAALGTSLVVACPPRASRRSPASPSPMPSTTDRRRCPRGRDPRPAADPGAGVIAGIALLIVVNLVGVGPSRAAIVAGHVLVALPTTVIVMRGAFAAIPRSIPEAAADLGATDAIVFRRVLLPLALPAAASAFMLAFLTSFDEFIVAFFLAGTEPTLPLYVWSQLRFPKSLPTVMALGSVILAVSILIAGAAELVRRRGLALARPSQA